MINTCTYINNGLNWILWHVLWDCYKAIWWEFWASSKMKSFTPICVLIKIYYKFRKKWIVLRWSQEWPPPSQHHFSLRKTWSNLSAWLETPTHAIHLSTHLLFRAKVTLPSVLLWGLTSFRTWSSILDALHPLHGTDPSAYPLGVSVSPWQPIFTPLDCRRGRPPLSSSCGVWKGANEVSDTDSEAELSRELRAMGRPNNMSDLEAVSFGDTRAQRSARLQLLGEQPLSSAYVSMLKLQPCG